MDKLREESDRKPHKQTHKKQIFREVCRQIMRFSNINGQKRKEKTQNARRLIKDA